jgi:hypothetical protein
MPRKPDRFERAATRAAYKLTWDKKHPDGVELQTAIVNELRKEHRWVERMIRSIQKLHIEHMDEWIVLDSVLKQLKQRRK